MKAHHNILLCTSDIILLGINIFWCLLCFVSKYSHSVTAVIAERRCSFIHFHTGEGEDSNIHNIHVNYQAHSIILSEIMELLARKENWLSGHSATIFTTSLTGLSQHWELRHCTVNYYVTQFCNWWVWTIFKHFNVAELQNWAKREPTIQSFVLKLREQSTSNTLKNAELQKVSTCLCFRTGLFGNFSIFSRTVLLIDFVPGVFKAHLK